ncbi:MAG TPA: hypothetical protein VFQ54_13560 [Thermomicrobiales bacterium]|nr:hypothetical protein [Thermomicrobiales bacterium]
MNRPQPNPLPPNELYVVGERKDNPIELLLQGTDGRYYVYQPPDEDPKPVDVAEDSAWQIEDTLPTDIKVEPD